MLSAVGGGPFPGVHLSALVTHPWKCPTSGQQELSCRTCCVSPLAASVFPSALSRSVISESLRPPDHSPPGSSVHGGSPGKNTGVGCDALLQGVLATQGWNPGLLHCRQVPYHLSHRGSPRILQWVASPSSRGPSQPRNRTGVSCLAGSVFTSWAAREALAGFPY